jgi:hypothetical protein
MALLTTLQCSCSVDQFSIEEDEPAGTRHKNNDLNKQLSCALHFPLSSSPVQFSSV